MFLYINIHYKNSDGTETEEIVKDNWSDECQRDMPDSLRLTNICTVRSLFEKLYEKESSTYELPQITFRNLTCINLGEKCIAEFDLLHSNKQVVLTICSTIKNF